MRKGKVFRMFCGSGRSKSRLAKAAGAEPGRQMRDEKLHAVVARSAFASKKCQTLGFRATFDVSDVVLFTDRRI